MEPLCPGGDELKQKQSETATYACCPVSQYAKNGWFNLVYYESRKNKQK